MSVPGYSRSQLKNRGWFSLCALGLGAYATLEMKGGSPVYLNYWKQPVFAASVVALAALLAVGAALP